MMLLSAILPIVACAAQRDSIDKSVVADVDIERYMGKWYEIARFENRFERGMNYVTAEYWFDHKGRIKVLNSGLKSDATKRSSSEGRVKIPNKNIPAKLKVSFFLWFWGDYWILELDQKDYSYALVGSSNSEYLWILSREPIMKQQTLSMLVESARRRGYDVDNLIYVEQSAP